MNLIFQGSAAIAAAATALPLAGDPAERPPFDAFCRFGCNGSAAGLRVSLWVGGRAEVDDYQINALNRFVVHPDDVFVRDSMCPAMALNRIAVRNPTAGALTHFTFFGATALPFFGR